MSTNRSVQAAQRRRAGPPEPQQVNRGPTTSINSAQMFANQARPGNGPNIPNGRLAGQQAAYSQQQMMQQQKQEKDPNFSKLTVAQAITLITLRLGAVETKIIELEHNGISNSNIEGSDNNVVQIDKNILNTIMNRLEALEKRSSNQGTNTISSSSSDVGLIKQQLEAIKPAVVQSKNAVVNLMKTNENLRVDIDNLRSELVDIRGNIENVQMLTMEHDKSLNSLLFGSNENNENDENDNENENENENINIEQNLDYNALTADLDLGLNTEDLKDISFSFTDE